METVRAFLENWKPYATMGPGNPVRRSILRLLETDDSAKREELLVKVSDLYRLHRIYGELDILRDGAGAKGDIFRKLLAVSAADFAAAIRAGEQKEYLQLLLEGFEFDRAAAPANQLASRQFLHEMWAMRPGQPAMKYTLYAKGVLYSAHGKTHDQMARDFAAQGFGSGNPVGGGFLRRDDALVFAYDTHSSAAKSSGDARRQVDEALKRWVRVTGADETKVSFTYEDSVA